MIYLSTHHIFTEDLYVPGPLRGSGGAMIMVRSVVH